MLFHQLTDTTPVPAVRIHFAPPSSHCEPMPG